MLNCYADGADSIRMISLRHGRRAEARRRQAEADHAEYLTWMHDLCSWMDRPKGYDGGLTTEVVVARSEADDDLRESLDAALRQTLTA
jgi:hypothetical protein